LCRSAIHPIKPNESRRVKAEMKATYLIKGISGTILKPEIPRGGSETDAL